MLNHSVRLLGRGGVMSVDLVVSPEHYQRALPAFNGVIGKFEYKAGHTYAEWRDGDKIAAYGLTALVAGGAGAVLAKTGLLQKFGKAIVLALGGGRGRHPEADLRQGQGRAGQRVTGSLLDGVNWEVVAVFAALVLLEGLRRVPAGALVLKGSGPAGWRPQGEPEPRDALAADILVVADRSCPAASATRRGAHAPSEGSSRRDCTWSAASPPGSPPPQSPRSWR